MKTILQVVDDLEFKTRLEKGEAIYNFALQVAEVVRDEAIEQARSPLLQERIRKIDFTQFIK